MEKKNDVIRDRHTGAVLRLKNLKASGNPPGIPYPIRNTYLGARHPIELRTANLRGADLSGVDVTGKDLSDADLTGANLEGLKFDARTHWPDGFYPVLLGAVEVPLDLGGQNCDGQDFAGQTLVDANFAGASLVGADLTNADLSRANLRGVTLTEARLDGANLTGASLRGAKCGGASFQNARLVDAELDVADLADADLTGADLTGVSFDSRTRWPEGFTRPAPAVLTRADSREELAACFKALSDPVRLTMLGLLLSEEHTGEELADTLGVTEPNVSHHVARLRDCGLITVRAEGTRRIYRTTPEQIDGAVDGLADRLSTLVRREVNPDVFTQKVLEAFFEGNRLKSIPARQKKQRVVLERLAQEFTPGVHYPEREVNAILQRFHEDCATLRRLFIAERLFAREKGIYWRL